MVVKHITQFDKLKFVHMTADRYSGFVTTTDQMTKPPSMNQNIKQEVTNVLSHQIIH